MLFSGITFLFYFLPSVLFFYFIAPNRYKNHVLVLASVFFYAWGEPGYVLIMAVSLTSVYLFAMGIERHRNTRLGKRCLILSVTVSLSLLVYFKYADFFIENFNAATHLSIPLLKAALPIGISFYTFQLISYSVDVYRGERAQKNYISLAAYVFLFAQLIAGPIVRYGEIQKQLSSREHTFEDISYGIRRFITGLSKKVLLANQFAEITQIFINTLEPSVLFYYINALAFCLQIYFDFSGYSDMAIGLGRIFGFRFSENFNYPYIASSITQFWRRWHISLGTWFRDYVYIPLGGNRVSPARHIFNIITVWFLTGFWHGAEWNFIVWGLYFAVLLLAEKYLIGNFLKSHPLLSHIYVTVLILFGMVIFNADSLPHALNTLRVMTGFGNLPLTSSEALYTLRNYLILFIFGIMGSTPLPAVLMKKFSRGKYSLYTDIAQMLFLCALLILVTAYLVDGSFNPFLYFRF